MEMMNMENTHSELVGTIRTTLLSEKYLNNKYLPAKIKRFQKEVSANYGCPGSVQQLTDVKANLVLTATHVSQEWKRSKDGNSIDVQCVITFQIVDVLGTWR